MTTRSVARRCSNIHTFIHWCSYRSPPVSHTGPRYTVHEDHTSSSFLAEDSGSTSLKYPLPSLNTLIIQKCTVKAFLNAIISFSCLLQLSSTLVSSRHTMACYNCSNTWSLTADTCSQAWDAGSAFLLQCRRRGPVVEEEGERTMSSLHHMWMQ